MRQDCFVTKKLLIKVILKEIAFQTINSLPYLILPGYFLKYSLWSVPMSAKEKRQKNKSKVSLLTYIPYLLLCLNISLITLSISWGPVSSCLTGRKRFQHSIIKPCFTFRKTQVRKCVSLPCLSAIRQLLIPTRPHFSQTLPRIAPVHCPGSSSSLNRAPSTPVPIKPGSH